MRKKLGLLICAPPDHWSKKKFAPTTQQIPTNFQQKPIKFWRCWLPTVANIPSANPFRNWKFLKISSSHGHQCFGGLESGKQTKKYNMSRSDIEISQYRTMYRQLLDFHNGFRYVMGEVLASD